MYARAHFTPKIKNNVKSMTNLFVNSLKETFKQTNKQSDWMSAATKQSAMEKIKEMIPHLLYSDEVLDNDAIDELYKSYTSMEITDNYANNIDSLMPASMLIMVEMGLAGDRKGWKGVNLAPIANAGYSARKNQFIINMGWMDVKTYDEGRPDIFNYAILGWVIGHEITHGFDSTGRQYNFEGDCKIC